MKFSKKLFPMKAHFFMVMAGDAPIFPFLPLILKGLGFSSISVGWIFTAYPLTVIFAKPLSGTIADKYRCHTVFMIFILFVHLITGFIIQWTPSIPFETKAELLCDRNLSLRICSGKLNEPIAGNVKYIDKIGTSLNNTITCKVDNEKWKKYTGRNNQFEDEETFIRLGPKYYSVNSCLVTEISHLFDTSTYSAECKNETSILTDIQCENADIMEIIKQKSVNDEAEMGTTAFWIAFALVISYRVSGSVMQSFSDAFCFNLLGDKPQNYGAQRMWGAASWGIFAFINGIVVDKFSEGMPNKNFLPSYYMLLVLLLLDVLVFLKIKVKFTKQSQNLMGDMKTLFTDLRICLFMFWCFLGGVYCAIIWNFLFWFIEDLALSSPGFDQSRLSTLEGLMLTVQCYLGEIPFFFTSGWILKKVGPPKSMVIVLFAIAIRFLLYSSLTDPWWVLPIEVLNGVTFGLFYAVMVTYASSIAPPGTEATVQNIVGSLFEGGGISTGSLLGGYMFKRVGSSKTLLILGISALGFTLIYLFLQSKLETTTEKKGAIVIKEIPEEKNKEGNSEELDKLTEPPRNDA
ncbi:major facilitator superfamily domain-containing protein 6-B isoform X2 [Halyomorpha halys]|uniref:major facilitator superfamily domain-containing protein 6-B isoform X1 n=1 Tax=Halyomorpha halys TaxID=286706 RepID=UPI0006D50F53|nr:major facilitator superfamily domain-containing protein 6-B-like [Halyomorpha halys]XP_014287828.1 major facilitator superfamily domain-containing protein 6-B-like [Halyomorpha halys]